MGDRREPETSLTWSGDQQCASAQGEYAGGADHCGQYMLCRGDTAEPCKCTGSHEDVPDQDYLR